MRIFSMGLLMAWTLGSAQEAPILVKHLELNFSPQARIVPPGVFRKVYLMPIRGALSGKHDLVDLAHVQIPGDSLLPLAKLVKDDFSLAFAPASLPKSLKVSPKLRIFTLAGEVQDSLEQGMLAPMVKTVFCSPQNQAKYLGIVFDKTGSIQGPWTYEGQKFALNLQGKAGIHWLKIPASPTKKPLVFEARPADLALCVFPEQ